MKIVGLTGGIGSGKTTISRVFASLGVPVYNADGRGKWLSDNNRVIVNGLKTLFGDDIYGDGKLDRPRLASIIFNDKELLQKVNSIIHPVVYEDFTAWAHQHSQYPYVIKEAAILIENGGYKSVDKLVLVVAPEDVRIARVMRRDRMGEEQVRDRIKNQMSDKEKLQFADFVVYCDDNHLVISQVLNIHNEMIQI